MKKRVSMAIAAGLVGAFAAVTFPAQALVNPQTQWHARLTCTTNSTGHCTQIYNHPIGATPVVQVTPEGLTAIVHTYQVNASSFRVRVMQTTSTPWANKTLTLAASAYAVSVIEPSASPSGPSVPPSTSVQPSASVSPSPSVSTPPVANDYPTEATTGVPAGTALTLHSGNLIVTTPNTIVQNRRVTGNIDVRAAGVLIKNTQVDGIVVNDNVSAHPTFTIEDSTVGTSTCSRHTAGAIGTKNYTAKRVKLQNFPDGFRIAGSNVLIQDSYVKLCSADPADHSDGIQAYGAGAATNVVIDHNVIDQTGVPGERQTAPIFIPNDHAGQGNQGISVTVTNNVLAGGSYSLRVFGDLPWSAPSISGNKIVNNTWGFGPVDRDMDCARVAEWKDNAVVTYDFAQGKILSEVRALSC
jgi:hypothetical protein